MCHLTGELTAWTVSLTSTPTLSVRGTHYSQQSMATPLHQKYRVFLATREGEDLCGHLYGIVQVVMHDSHHTAYLINGVQICPAEDAFWAQRWRCWWKNKAPWPAVTRQTDIRWSLVFCLGGLLGRTAVSWGRGRGEGSPRFTNNNTDKQAIRKWASIKSTTWRKASAVETSAVLLLYPNSI